MSANDEEIMIKNFLALILKHLKNILGMFSLNIYEVKSEKNIKTI